MSITSPIRRRPPSGASAGGACQRTGGVCTRTACGLRAGQEVRELKAIECGDGERSVKRAEKLDGAGPEALVLQRHLFSQQQRQRCHVVKDQALLLRLEERTLAKGRMLPSNILIERPIR